MITDALTRPALGVELGSFVSLAVCHGARAPNAGSHEDGCNGPPIELEGSGELEGSFAAQVALEQFDPLSLRQVSLSLTGRH